jgi:hypothetical protein
MQTGNTTRPSSILFSIPLAAAAVVVVVVSFCLPDDRYQQYESCLFMIVTESMPYREDLSCCSVNQLVVVRLVLPVLFVYRCAVIG